MAYDNNVTSCGKGRWVFLIYNPSGGVALRGIRGYLTITRDLYRVTSEEAGGRTFACIPSQNVACALEWHQAVRDRTLLSLLEGEKDLLGLLNAENFKTPDPDFAAIEPDDEEVAETEAWEQEAYAVPSGFPCGRGADSGYAYGRGTSHTLRGGGRR